MGGKINAKELNRPFTGVSSSLLPSLSPYLNSLYNSLDDDSKQVFIKVFRFIWGVVNDRSIKQGGFISHYWLFYSVVAVPSSPLSLSAYSVLSFIYMATNRGVNLIHSDILYNSGCVPGAIAHTYSRITWDLKDLGYITRHTKDPGQPYSQRAQHNKQPVFIKMTTKGVQMVQNIEKDLNRLLLNISLNDLTGTDNKKAG